MTSTHDSAELHADLYRGFGSKAPIPTAAPGGQREDDRGTHVETAHFRTPFEADGTVAPVLASDGTGVRRDLEPVPHGLDAGNQHGADEHDDERAVIAIEVTDQALVAREQARHGVD